MFKLSNYYKPTPKKLRKLGDSILACTGIISSSALINYDQLKEVYSQPQLRGGITCIILLGILGKFLTNFFKEEEQQLELNNEIKNA